MKILVCGSRNWTDEEKIKSAFLALATNKHVVVIHGAAKGADSIAAHIADDVGWEVLSYPAEWDKYGKLAGFKRNLQMLDLGPDLVLAFQVGQSRGTQHTIDSARERGIPVKVYHD